MISLIRNVFHRRSFRGRKIIGSQGFGLGKEMGSRLLKGTAFLSVLINMIKTVLMVTQLCE